MHGNILNKNKLKLFNTANSDLAGRISILENNVYKVTYYEIISGASGTITIPTAATINSNEFSGANCVLSEIDVNNKPTWVSPKDAGGTVVTATLNTSTGAWLKSGVTVSANVALIYSLNIRAADYFNLTNFYIIDEVVIGDFSYVLNNTTNNSVLSSLLASVMSDETGSGALVFGTSPTFTTDITTPKINGVSGNLLFTNAAQSSGAVTDFTFTKANHTGQTAGTAINGMLITLGSRGWTGGSVISTQKEVELTSPTYNFTSTNTISFAYTLYVNKPTAGANATLGNNNSIGADGAISAGFGSGGGFKINTNIFAEQNGTGTFSANGVNIGNGFNHIVFIPQAANTSGAITQFTFTIPSVTGQTASTEIPSLKVTGNTKTWAAGAITTQRWNYFTANTAAFASASTITNSYGLYVEAATAGTNATITNNFALGLSGSLQLSNNTTISGIDSAGTNRPLITWSSSDNITITGRAGTSDVVINPTSGGIGLYVKSNGDGSIGVASPSARWHIVKTSEQLRVGYDTTNYCSNTVSSAGVLTIAMAGTDPSIKILNNTSHKLSFWNATPIVQPTTAVAAATFVANTSGIANDTATFDGYTIGQVVNALRNTGLLA